MATPRDAAELENRLQNVTEKLLGAYEELDFVHSMAEVLGRPEGVDDLDDYLLRETLGIFRADGGWVARRDSEGDLRTSAARGFQSRIPEILNPLAGGLAARGALPILVDDLPGALARRQDLAAVDSTLREKSGADGFPRAFLAVPLSVSTDVLGVICLGKLNPGDVFTAGESKLLNTLALQATLFMKNVERVERFRAEARSLGRRVQQLEADPARVPDISWIRGPSPAMRRVAKQVEQAAATDATMLLLGESGTGKSLVARILHRLSARVNGSFVEVNCGAVPPGLIESELFGHVRGAFTGADRTRPGLFEEADGGTIFLDEVAELPLEAQVKLLTVLEHQRVRRVGENRDRPVDVRVIAATNADLGGSVRDGRFREDLFYRLNVLNLTVPPLRQREEDILHLARKFLADLARETNRRMTGFGSDAEAALLAYPWPGNVRELRNVVERSLLLKSEGDRIEAGDLPLPSSASVAPQVSAPALDGRPLGDAVRDYEKALILDALRRNGGVVSQAATALQISRTNLHNKLRRHGLFRKEAWQEDGNE